jgi:hypothetical protein
MSKMVVYLQPENEIVISGNKKKKFFENIG